MDVPTLPSGVMVITGYCQVRIPSILTGALGKPVISRSRPCLLGNPILTHGVELVEHEVDDYACHTDIEPYGKHQPGDLAVSVITPPEAADERQYHEGANHGCEDRVRRQYGQVNGPDDAFA